MGKKIRYTLFFGALVLAAGFVYYAVSPLFRNVTVLEEVPVGVEMLADNSDTWAEVIGTLAHPASGWARVVEADGSRYIRYEELRMINGPDIFVYLSKDKEAKEFVNLGRVRATQGSLNYKIPADVTLSEYPYVLTWCRAFDVLFNYADLRERITRIDEVIQ